MARQLGTLLLSGAPQVLEMAALHAQLSELDTAQGAVERFAQPGARSIDTARIGVVGHARLRRLRLLTRVKGLRENLQKGEKIPAAYPIRQGEALLFGVSGQGRYSFQHIKRVGLRVRDLVVGLLGVLF